MTVSWIPLLCGLFFGLIPSKLLLTSECRYLRLDAVWNRVVFSKKNSAQRRRRWWKLPLVWIDPIRGYFVAYQLDSAFGAVQRATMMQRIYPIAATLLVLFIVVWVQTSGRRDEDETISPTAFLGGMMIALLPLTVSLSAIVLGASSAIVMNRFASGYVIAALATAGIGYMFINEIGGILWLAVYTVIVAAPLTISWMQRTSLVMPVRC